MLYTAVVAPGRLQALPHCPHYNGRIMYKHAVALKALNPKDLKHEDIIFLPSFLELNYFLYTKIVCSVVL
jgi:hypothetical protein